MKKISVVLFAFVAMVFAHDALAVKTKVDPDKLKAAGATGTIYGRSDGVFQSAVNGSPVAVENGQRTVPLGAGVYEDFSVYGALEGLSCMDQSGLGACGGNTTLVPCICTLASGTKFISMPMVTADTPPAMAAGYLNIASDNTDNDGLAIIFGVGGASGRPFVIGRDPAFHICAKLGVQDASGIDQSIIGFMGQGVSEAWNADFEARTDYAGIGPLGTAASGLTYAPIYTKTEVGGVGVVSTNTTDRLYDTVALAKTFCTKVSAAGVVTYTIDGAAPTTSVAYTFTDNLSVVPYITFLQTNDITTDVAIYSLDIGFDQ